MHLTPALPARAPVTQCVITEEEAGQRIDNYLHTFLKGCPRSLIYRLLRTGQIRINKKRIKPAYRLQLQDQIRIPPLQTTPEGPRNSTCLKRLIPDVLYEDERIFVINKSPKIAVHGGSGLTSGLIEQLRASLPEMPFLELVHRLDRETSGVLLLAKRRSALRHLHEQLRSQRIQKTYLAIVEGTWPSALSQINRPLRKNRLSNGERMVIVAADGKASETHFSVLEYFQNATLLQIKPLTGRTHQIRVHTAHAGHPILGDKKYGCQQDRKKPLVAAKKQRLFLHAKALSFSHPKSEALLTISAPLDNDFTELLTLLRTGQLQGI